MLHTFSFAITLYLVQLEAHPVVVITNINIYLAKLFITDILSSNFVISCWYLFLYIRMHILAKRHMFVSVMHLGV